MSDSRGDDSVIRQTVTFNSAQINIISNLRQQGRYADAYSYVYDVLRFKNVDPATLYWFQQASRINGGSGAVSAFIRNFTTNGLRLSGRSTAGLQNISNSIAEKVLGDIVQAGGVRALPEILARDISEVTGRYGVSPTGNLAGWGGSFYYWDMPIWDEATKSYKYTEVNGVRNYLTIGDIISNDPGQRTRFAITLGRTLSQMVTFGNIADSIFHPSATYSALSAIARLPADIQDRALAEAKKDPTFLGFWMGLTGTDSTGKPVFMGISWSPDGSQEGNASEEIQRALDRLAPFVLLPEPPPTALQIAVTEGLNALRMADGGQLGLALGSVIGQRLTSDPFAQIVASGTLSTVLGAVGEYIDNDLFHGATSTNILGAGLEGFGETLLQNIKGAGIGALSSYLTAEVLKAAGLNGVPGEIANSVGGAVVTQILTNISSSSTAATPFAGVSGGLVVNAIGSYLGTKLASVIKTWDSVGGQIGSAVGAAYGGFAAAPLFEAAVATGNVYLFAAAVAVVAIDTLLGGLIGSIFGGTPRSGADASWDEAGQHFVVANVYARKGGSRDAAVSIATTVADNFNAVLDASGSLLMDPSAVRSGNYGMRNKDFVYRPQSTQDPDAITARFRGEDAAGKLIDHGTYIGLSDMVGQMAGGNIYVKRALATSLANVGGNPNGTGAGVAGAFDMTTLLGDMSTAGDYAKYMYQKGAIDALIAADPQTGFAAGWLITLARAAELGLNRRGATDWTGGYQTFLDEQLDGKIDGSAILPVQLIAGIDEETQLRFWTVVGSDNTWLGVINDTIEARSLTAIVGTSGDDTIRLGPDALLATSGATNVGLTVNGVTHDGSAVAIAVAATIEAGDGNDIVYASDRGDNVSGGAGDDVLYGGRLDDWLIGGEGNDVLDAGSATSGSLGGDGNYLEGGLGDDTLRGREGSDWLQGGEGVDQLDGGAGDDVLDAGAGEGEIVKGGAGSDQYIFRRGDGHDTLIDESGAVAANAVQTRLVNLAAGLVQRDWTSGGATGQGLARGGEDAIVFGEGIDFRDLVLRRSTGNGGPGQDLIIELTETDANGAQVPTGDVLTIQNWFDETRRIEWLKFADGTEVRIGDVTSYIIGTGGDDLLIGTQGGDFLSGGDGNDTIWGLGGNDFGFGGRGKDFISGDDDNDWVVGGDDDDQVIGGYGNDAVFGDAGNDLVYGAAGNDLLSGGRGNDQLVGGVGNDLFRFERGDGHDTLFDEYFESWELVWENGSYVNGFTLDPQTGDVIKDGVTYFHDGTWNGIYNWDQGNQRLFRNRGGGTAINAGDDTLEFGLGIAFEDVQLQRSGNDLLLGVGSENAGSFALIADQILLKDWYATGTPIEHFVFIDVGRLDLAGWSVGAAVSDGDDAVTGTGAVDWITGGLGNDTLAGGGGNDILSGNTGDDIVKGDSGADVLYGGAGNDLLEGGAGADVLSGGSGIDIASYAQSVGGVRVSLADPGLNNGDAAGDKFVGIEGLEGSQSADQLAGDQGDNILRGKGGNDRLQGGGGDDSYEFGRGDGDDIVEDGLFDADQILDADGALDTAHYAANWTYLGQVENFGSWHAYRLTVRRVADNAIVYESRDGIDFLYPSLQAQMPPGAAWPFAADQWKLGATRTGNGVQTVIVSEKAGDGGEDTLELGAGISLSDLTAAWENGGKDLRITVAGGGSVLLRNQSSPDRRIETLTLADGVSIDLARLRLSGDAATAGDDAFLGTSGADMFDGSGGDDVLSGGDGDDALSGGDGDDVLEGGAGADVLTGGSDSVASGHAALANDPSGNYGDTVRYTRSAQAVSVFLSSGMVFGGDAEGDVLSGIENVTGSEAGNDFVDGSSVANRLIGLGGDDILLGNGGDDVLIGGDGNDSLQGGDGEDVISGDAGNDNISGGAGNDLMSGGEGGDTISGGNGNDRLNGDSGGDTLRGDAGDDILSGGDGDDFLYGGSDNDTLVGGAGMDTVSGDDGNDILVGGAENDLLQGGYGHDTYTFDAAAGANRILDKVGVNKIAFSEVSFDKIWLTRSGSDLLIQAIGTNAAITVQGYFASSNPSLMTSISTGTHTLFLAGAATLIDAMTAAGPLPGAMPQSIGNQLAGYWVTASSAPHVADQSRTTSEDIPLSGAVGAVDEENDISSFTVSAAPTHGVLALHATAGTWTYTPGADWSGSDGFDIQVTDAEGHSTVQHVTVVVAPVNDAPRTISPGTLSVTEIAQDGALIGALSATDPDDPAGVLTYSLEDNAGGRFRITSDGQLLVNRTPEQILAGRVLDFEAAQNHTIRVRVTDPSGAIYERQLTVAVTDVNEAPQIIFGPSQLSIGEDKLGGQYVGGVSGYDPDSGDQLSFSLDDDAGGIFEISSGGTLQLAAGVVLDHEAVDAYTIVVRATDRGGLSITRALTIDIADVNEAPADIAADRVLTFSENLAVGTMLAQFSGTDPENNITSFTLVDNAGGRFAMQPNGVLTVGSAGLDYEAAASQSIVVRVTDAGGLTRDESFTISLVNVNEAPSDIVAPTLAVNENAANGTLIGTLTAADPDTPATGLTFALDDNAGGRFAISADGKLTVTSGTALNYEAAASHAITVRVTDSGGLTRVENFIVDVANVNEAPTSLTLTATGATVTERDRIGEDPAPPAILLGTLAGTDPDLPSSGTDAVLAYSVTDPRFEIRNGNELWLKAGAMADLDYEANPNVSVSVTVKDRAGGTGALSYTRSFTFALTNRDDILIGTSASDVLYGQTGRDILRGLGGDDRLFGATGNDDLYGGDGVDTLNGEDGDDRLYGELGNDGLLGGAGADLLDGGDGNDTLSGGDGGDTLQGGAGLDTLDGGTGNDLLYGGGDADTLTGGAGADRLEGGSGDDILAGGADADRFLGGGGVDTVTYAAAGAAIAVDLATGTGSAGEAQGDVFEDAPEILVGSAYGDQLTGSGASDTIYGGAGNDVIYGGAGSDQLFGGDGNDYIDAQGDGDILDGGTGSDILIGGTGDDTYRLNSTSGADEIRNFDPNGTDIDVIGYDDIGREKLWFERSGDNLVITAVGTSTVTTVKDYFLTPVPGDPGNFKIDFIIAGQHYTVDADGLVALMAGYTKPATASAYTTLHANLAFENQWKNFWDENGAPVIGGTAPSPVYEPKDGAANSRTLTINVTDDITPVTGISVTAFAVNPNNPAAADNSIIQSVSVGTPNASGDRTLTFVLNGDASGPAMIKIVAVDPGGLTTEKLLSFNVTPTADTPTITIAQPATPTAPLLKPTLDSGSWALNVQAALKDQDGSETLEVRIAGLPTGLSFNQGTNLGSGIWSFTPAQLVGLRLVGPATWSQDLALTVTAIAREAATGETASTSTALNVVLNARPNDLVPDRAVEVNENAAAGTLVANFATTDGDTGDTRTYSLLNNAGGRFQINAGTGAVTVATGAVLDYEAAGGASQTIRIQVQDSGGLTYAEDVAIAVKNVNEVPTDVWADRTLAFTENTAVGTGLAWFLASDPENNISSYSLLDSAGGRFALRSDGLLMVGSAGLNYEAGASQQILVRATDAGGLVRDEWFTVTIGNVNENPIDISADRALTFNENIVVGTGLAWFGGTDPEGNISSYSLVNDAGGRFSMSSTGLLMVGAAGLNYEAGASQTIVVRATDAGGLTYDESFTVTIGNVNENPTDIWEDRALSFSENLGVGTGLAWFGGSDPEGNIASYSLVNSAGGRFSLRSDGLLMIGSAGLDYEAGASQSIVVRVTDAGGLTRDEAFTVTIGNVNEAPTDIWADRSLVFNENYGVGTGLAWFGGADPEGNIASYSLLDSAGGRFSMDSNGLLRVGSAGLNYEAGATQSILVRATDVNGLVYDEWFNVGIANLNEAPTDLWADRTLAFSENLGVGTGLAWFGGSDPEGNITSYSLVNDAGGSFSLRSDGLLMVGAAGLNYEAGATQSILVRATDAGGAIYDEWFTVSIGDLNEAPTVSGANLSINENAGPGTYVGSVSFGDPDGLSSSNGNVRLSLSGTGASNFTIDSSTGAIYYQQGTLYDQDVAGHLSDYNLTVTVQDQGGTGLAASAAVNIHVNAVNEAPKIQYATMQYYSSYSAVLQVTPIDPEGNAVTMSLHNLSTGQPVSGGGGQWTVYSGSNPRNFSGNFQVTLSDGISAPRVQNLWINGSSVTWNPVVLDLDGDGLELRAFGEGNILFDMDGDGNVEPCGWVSGDDAILAIDRNGNGMIDNGGEINLAGDQEGALSDLEGLRSYDTNGNGFFDDADAQFSAFRLWRDLNQDGVSQAEELSSLADMGISAINLTLNPTGETNADDTGNLVYGTTQFVRSDGSLGLTGDVGLAYQRIEIAIADVDDTSSARRLMLESAEPDPSDQRVDQMRQAMASFSVGSGNFERSAPARVDTYDLFASAA